jgi:hypothetical protein
VVFHPRQDLANLGADVVVPGYSFGDLAHGGVFFDYGESGLEGSAHRLPRCPFLPEKAANTFELRPPEYYKKPVVQAFNKEFVAAIARCMVLGQGCTACP